MTTHKLLREVIRRMLVEEVAPDAMGDVVFSPNRTDDVPKDEPNTELETHLFNQLRGWIRDYMPMSHTSVELMNAAIDNPKYYDYIHRAPPEDVYRGMTVKRTDLARWLGISDPLSIPPKGQSDTTYVLKPEISARGIKPLSFSRNDRTARAFAETATGMFTAKASYQPGSTLRVLWQADTQIGGNEFIDIESMQRRTSKLSPGGEEGEVISFKPVQTVYVWWWTEDEVEHLDF